MDLVQRTINTNNGTACLQMGANSWGKSNKLDNSTNAIQLGKVPQRKWQNHVQPPVSKEAVKLY